MSPQVQKFAEPIEYPDSDGQPVADNTKQFRWIVTLQGNLDLMFRDDPNVFVAGDLLWYPVEGDNVTRTAPDAMVVWGRPKGDRGSYQQWKEGGIAPQVVFEVLSPGNRAADILRKFKFYERFGVEEYYVYDPDDNAMKGWIRRRGSFDEIGEMNGWVSPRLGVRFDLSGEELRLYTPDGQPFSTFMQQGEERESNRQRAEHAEQRVVQAEQRAERAEQRAEQERQRAEQERQRVERLEAHLRSLGVEPQP